MIMIAIVNLKFIYFEEPGVVNFGLNQFLNYSQS